MSEVLNPEEIKKRRRIIVEEEEQEEIEEKVEKNTEEKMFNKGNTTQIIFESMGRFSIPKELYIENFKTKHINDITLSREEELLENILVITDDLIVKKPIEFEGASVAGEMIAEEFLEILIGIKQTFQTPLHDFRWICECQDDKEGNDRIINTSTIDLREINYQSIEQADEIIRELFKTNIIDPMSDEEFRLYLETKYSDRDDAPDFDIFTKEDEIKSIKIVEPFNIRNEDGNRYGFNLLRMKNIISAQKMAKNKWASELKQAENLKIHGVPLSELKAKKQEMIEDIKYKQGKDVILFSKAFMLQTKNGEELSDSEKIEIYSSLPNNVTEHLDAFINSIELGVQHNQDFICPICGETKRRSLQQELNPLEFLPVGSPTPRKLGESKSVNIFIG